MAAWGLAKEVLAERFPRLVQCSLTGFGADGPLGGRPGYDAVIQGLTGMFVVNGDPTVGPTRIGVPIVDIATGLYSVIAILMALIERQRSGRGQHLDMTLFDCGMAIMHPHMANWLLSGKEAAPTGNAHTNISPYDTFQTGTVPLFLAVGNNRAFERLCTTIGAVELLSDPRFVSNGTRLVHRAELKEALELALARHDGATLWRDLIDKGVPAGPTNGVAAAISHPHTAHRHMVAETEGYRGLASPIKPSRSQAALRHKPPRFAEHTAEILSEAGVSPERQEQLAQSGAVIRQRRK